jgi:hypothetical protein
VSGPVRVDPRLVLESVPFARWIGDWWRAWDLWGQGDRAKLDERFAT